MSKLTSRPSDLSAEARRERNSAKPKARTAERAEGERARGTKARGGTVACSHSAHRLPFASHLHPPHDAELAVHRFSRDRDRPGQDTVVTLRLRRWLDVKP